MRLERLVGERFKEKPADCIVDSHAFMARGGYMKFVASGIFSQYPPLKRICKKIEEIIREEMDKIDGQEVQFPVVMPASLWEESGRYQSIAGELVRFQDRNNTPMVLGMTHEEAAVQLVREYGNSYNKYPFMIYQIQTKFRDEKRPRAGLIRVREFTMKDAYSFHTSQKDLEEYYERCYQAYETIYRRCGIPEVIAVKSDSGMMGGNVSHEYMLLTDIGEDSIVICNECDYRANMEVAEAIFEERQDSSEEELVLVETPHVETIEDLAKFFDTQEEHLAKAVVYQKNSDDSYVIVFIRGDLEVNETKVSKIVQEDIRPAEITLESGLTAGYIGPYYLEGKNVTVLFDRSLKGLKNLICGGNQEGYHYRGLSMERDVASATYQDLAKVVEGSICPCCGKNSISIRRGIEVGNIFQLGTKYTKSMNMQYLDREGNLQYPIMGCYGIGVGRLAASVCETHHDDYGPIWPMAIAPWQVHLCLLRADDMEAKAYADELYEKLQANGVEVIYDDRKVRPGVMFSDADLLGVPVRAIVSPKNMELGQVEIVTRDKSIAFKVSKDEAVGKIQELVSLMK